ncbi:MAG: DUF1015 domain-containing protein [Acidobacteriota bacterium]|nr:DUF1015 domain-containing protein [Acidobacteriota bacterium]
MRIYAFPGFRYAGDEAGDQAAPPFDQINDKLRQKLQDGAPHHFSHLTKPVEGEEGDPYQHSAALHQRWIDEGIVQRDGKPSLYPYRIEVADGSQRLGLLTLVGVEEPEAGIIRPHEQTLDKPFADRLSLLRATQVDYEPLMFLSDDPGTLEPLLEEDMTGQPIVTHQDAAGNYHHLYRLSDPQRIEAYRQLLAPCPAAIADGHHRYKTARHYATEIGAEEGQAAACKMAVLFSLRSEHLVIDPIHRGLAEAHDLSELTPLLASREPLAAGSGSELAAAVAAAPQPALGVRRSDGGTELWLLDPERMPDGLPPAADQLAVAHLHYILLPALGLTPANYLDGTVTYRSDPDELYQEVDSGDLAIGIWLPPMSAELFGKAISKGDLLPAKATRFLPKPVSGLVWSGHDAELL